MLPTHHDVERMKAIKYDSGKPRTDLLPPRVLLMVSKVLGFGAIKYKDYNYRKGKGLKFSQMYAATQRHILKWWDREDLDEETKLNHIYHAITELCMIADCIERKKGIDDRP